MAYGEEGSRTFTSRGGVATSNLGCSITETFRLNLNTSVTVVEAREADPFHLVLAPNPASEHVMLVSL